MAEFEGREWSADIARVHGGGARREVRKPLLAKQIAAALPHLESATEENLARLRNTPAGKQLLAEGWAEAVVWVRYMDGTWPQDMEDANPYRT